jgi:hypothetical protein
MRRLPEILALLLGALAFGVSGCGPDIQTICELTEDCVGGNEQDIEACVAYYDYQAEIASIEGCTSEYDELFACAEEVADCQSQDTGFPCMEDKDCTDNDLTSCGSGDTCRLRYFGFEDDKDCEVEQARYSRCIGK